MTFIYESLFRIVYNQVTQHHLISKLMFGIFEYLVCLNCLFKSFLLLLHARF